MMHPCSGRGIFRFLAMAILIALAVTLAMALPSVSSDGGEDSNQVPPLPEKAELNYPNLGSHLDELVATVEEGQSTSEDAAGDTPVHSGESVAVTIYLSGNVDGVVTFLEENGGDPRNVGEDYIEAYVPVTLLAQVSERSGVIRVREIVPPEPDFGPITGQGVGAHLATAWHEAGITGEGVKVGIIDVGFEGFQDLMGTEIPMTVEARCYTDLGVHTRNTSDCENQEVHGTAVAESLLDIAPKVSLYIANPTSGAELQSTVDWMVSEGVSVINRSVSGLFDGPGDGTSPYKDSPLKTVDRAVDGGITWVNSAGNYNLDTWFGPYSNMDGDAWVDFHGPGAERNYVRLPARDETIDFEVELRWEDSWRGATSDLNLFFYDGYTEKLVASSKDYQLGGSGDDPHERLKLNALPSPDPSEGRYFVAVSHEQGNAPDWIQLRVRVFGQLQDPTEGYSINNASESANPGMLAVGATHYWDTHTIANYSSRGPTPDGRVKPDIVGTACGETASYPPSSNQAGTISCWFPGTSQASPHVAGMAALVRQRFPDYTPAQVASYLKAFAQQRETPDPNNTWGHGFAQLPSPDRAHLVALYNATGGADWTNNTNWPSTAPIGQWHGVTTDSQGRVTELNLTSNQLKGEIPPELANLTNLEVLALGGNELTGPIPTWLGGLTNLEELHLWENELTGTIPAELSSLTKLQGLDLSANHLTGGIPPQLGNLSNLQELYLWGNGLAGTIPSELGSLTKLQRLSLSDNQLTGTIPTWLGSLTDLQELYLLDNRLMGTIPSELARLTRLEILALGDNQLTGKIPAELVSLTELKELSLSSNQLNGTIPTWLGTLTKLEDLHLWGNELSGEIPTELGSLTNLKELHLNSNQLTGEIPAELARLTKLENLSLWGNELTGAIPLDLGNLSNLEQLSLSSNQLTGEIPAELGSLASLEELWLSRNQLTGEIPVELASLSNLVQLVMWGNELTGEIPAELGNLANLVELHLADNQLTGEIPPELGNLANLEELYLWDNQLSGMVPQTLSELTMLESFSFYNNHPLCAPVDDAFQTWLGSISAVLGSSCAPADSPEDRAVLVQVHSATDGPNWTNNANWLSEEHPIRAWYGVTNDANGQVRGLLLQDNQLTGKIPSELGGLTKLERLYLNDNQLTGEIPSELGDLANLRVLSLTDNQLTGGIPAELGRLTNLTVLRLAGNQLTGCVPNGLRDVADNDLPQLELPFCQPYDANGDGAIDIGELFTAIDDYFAGEIGIGKLFTIIDLYFSGPA